MAFLEAIFGGGKPKPPAIADAPADAGVPGPEIIAAISAGVVHAAIMAAVAATVVHVRGSVPAVRIKRTGSVWVTAGRLQLMGNRQR